MLDPRQPLATIWEALSFARTSDPSSVLMGPQWLKGSRWVARDYKGSQGGHDKLLPSSKPGLLSSANTILLNQLRREGLARGHEGSARGHAQ